MTKKTTSARDTNVKIKLQKKTTSARDTDVTIKLQKKKLQVREILKYQSNDKKNYQCARY